MLLPFTENATNKEVTWSSDNISVASVNKGAVKAIGTGTANITVKTSDGDKTATCGDQNNPDLYNKQMLGKALCLPQTIGSTTGGLVLYCACAMQRQPACMLFSKPIDSLAAAGSILASVWLPDVKMPVVDSLGEEFLEYVKDKNIVHRCICQCLS